MSNREKLRAALSEAPTLYSTDGTPASEKRVALRIFGAHSPGIEWLVFEYAPETGVIFALCDLGVGYPELGYVTLDELAELDVEIEPGYRVTAEIDTEFTPGLLRDILAMER